MESQLEVKNLDHLGLVAGVMDELGMVEIIEEQLPKHDQNCISSGQVVKGLILNCFGFLSAPLYLFSEFFESKPVAHLLGEGVEAKHLNDDRIGRVLDELWQEGTTSVFLKVAMQAVERFEVGVGQVHLDSSSFSLEGDYAQTEGMGEEYQGIKICRGYSRDHRPDLKQYLVNLVCSGDGGVPLWLKVADGNQNDSQNFAGIMEEFRQQWQVEETVFVIDAAFYSEVNLKQVGSLKWISRVPQTLKAAQVLIQTPVEELTAVECPLKDYRIWESRQSYGGIEQRWLLIESQTRKGDETLWASELNKLQRRYQRQLKQLTQTVFACRPDACEALLRFQEGLEKYQLSDVSIHPGPSGTTPSSTRREGYRIRATLQLRPDTEEELSRQHSRFILATNLLDEQQWPPHRLLLEYKQQQKVERGFRFLKDPLFFTSSVFVKKPQRVEALALIMALTLLVYSLAERQLRLALSEQQQTVLDQRQRPTSRPTFRWILQKFQGIHFVLLNGVEQVTALSPERQLIIQLLGPPACKYYFLSS